MKKYIIGIIVISIFVVGGFVSSVSAQTTTETTLQEQINALLEQITSLQTQIAELTSKQGELRGELSQVKQLFHRQLREGLSGDEVTLLQELLAGDPSIYPEGLVTGFFGSLTKSAVKRFQKRHNIEQVGEVGPLTRARINQLFSTGAGNFGKIPPGLAKKFNLEIEIEIEIDDDDDEDGDDDTSTSSTSGHKLTVCHKGKNTLNIGIPAIPAHINHGDSVGRCDGDDGNGNGGGGEGDDTTAPIISGLGTSSLAATTTDIVWTTDEDSDSKVWYSTSTPVSLAPALTVEDLSLVTSHTLGLSSLATSTTYYYIAVSSDASGNIATSTQQSFTTADVIVEDTTAPIISGLGTSSLAATTTDIVWTTDEDSDSKVWYSTSTPVSLTSDLLVQDSSMATSHTLGLSELATSTTYYFIAISSDASDNTSTSTEQSFNTLSE